MRWELIDYAPGRLEITYDPWMPGFTVASEIVAAMPLLIDPLIFSAVLAPGSDGNGVFGTLDEVEMVAS